LTLISSKRNRRSQPAELEKRKAWIET